MKKASSLGGFGSLNELYEDAKLAWPHQARESVFGPYHHHYYPSINNIPIVENRILSILCPTHKNKLL
jgi:hypothetical protein